MALNFKDLGDTSKAKVFALLAGDAGIGKTTQATTFPQKETFIVSAENGLLSIAGSKYAAEEVTTFDRVLEILEREIPANPWIKHLCIDSLSELYDLINKEAKEKFTTSQNFAKHEYVETQLIHLIRVAKRLDVNCFFTCHLKEEKNGLNLEKELAFNGKLPEKIKRQFDLIIHYDRKEDENGNSQRVFICDPLLSKVAKARVSPFLKIELGSYEEPNLYKLTQKLTGQQ